MPNIEGLDGNMCHSLEALLNVFEFTIRPARWVVDKLLTQIKGTNVLAFQPRHIFHKHLTQIMFIP